MSKWPIFDNFALKFQALKNGPRKVKILVQVPQTQISKWVKDPSLWDGWFGQGDFLREGEVKTFRALFSRPAAFDPYAVLVLSTEFRTDRPIRTKLAGEFDNSSILRWQVRLLLLQVRNDLVTALSTVIWTIFGPQMLSYYIKYF